MSHERGDFHQNITERPRNSGSERYGYQHLERNEIRLLRGHVNDAGQLIGELHSFHLGDAPDYDALSYTWGSKTYAKPEQSLLINGKVLPVLESLYPFLRFLLDVQPTKWWWVDSISIDQDNKVEKSGQVPLMGEIFRTAQQTHAYLGEKANRSRQAIELLRDLAEHYLKTNPTDERIKITFDRFDKSKDQ